MNTDFHSIHNHHERAVLEAVTAALPKYPNLPVETMADVACVALNRLPPRYIRHEVDLAFYLTEVERENNERAIAEAVHSAFQFVLARNAMRARL
ncbi:MAG TPA: late competence development ComFB family protein [Rhizobacter sp.]|nr:late competence development ComFB family protein [Rhizobacter sp.]